MEILLGLHILTHSSTALLLSKYVRVCTVFGVSYDTTAVVYTRYCSYNTIFARISHAYVRTRYSILGTAVYYYSMYIIDTLRALV